MALAANVKQYFPPKNIQQMEADLCLLPLWWAEDGDAVIVQDIVEAESFVHRWEGICPNVVFTTWSEGYDALRKRTGRDFIPAPWGWNKAVAERYRRFGIAADCMPTDFELGELRRMASRELVCEYFSHDAHIGFPSPLFARTLDFLIPEGAEKLIFKSPWSSSGRGVFMADVPLEVPAINRLRGFLKTQGGFLVDRFYDKVMDFALEYDVREGGSVDFIGFSVFDTAEGGRYGGNVLMGQEDLRHVIEDAAETSLSDIIDRSRERLRSVLSCKYEGVAGVDMLVVNHEGRRSVHPCIEINLRMNMGVLAMNVYERLSSHGIDMQSETALTPERKSGFVCKCVDGRLVISFEMGGK
jgi:hypothetical protein